ncbi:MAG: serine O-acetyltransferase, partial [Magnetococcales bacterium]|nr:serine O-acetyltransferase [Magnetococcales bacterium]
MGVHPPRKQSLRHQRLLQPPLRYLNPHRTYHSAPTVLLCYPGLHALWFYRIGHWFWIREWHLMGRLLSHIGRFMTGIEIHPGATIGEGFFIDHGMGVVIGETTEVGRNVTLYHGVTLGGTSWNKGKRHPTLEDNVVVGAGAKVLGPITLSEGSRVGSNAVVVKDVPAHTTVVGVPGRQVLNAAAREQKKGAAAFPSYGEVERMPDPVARAVTCVLEQVHQMNARIEQLEEEDERVEQLVQ